MSIKNVEINSYKQSFDVPMSRKIEYGEVNTPFSIIKMMISMLPNEFIVNRESLWFDPACGCGYFPMVIYDTLMESLKDGLVDKEDRSAFILENMLILNEKNPIHREKLENMFGKKTPLFMEDFLKLKNEQLQEYIFNRRMCIIGNPPYNSDGLLKVPTNKSLEKKKDGIALWKQFIFHSLDIMKTGDFLLMIVPSLWMKPDKSGIYDELCKYKLHKIQCFNNTETNNIFHKKAQTPTCMFLLEKIPNDYIVSLYDRSNNCYKPHSYSIKEPIPLCGGTIVSKLKNYANIYGTIPLIKTNMPRKHIMLSSNNDDTYIYKNIHTCILQNNTQPQLVFKYSNNTCVHYGERKLVLAHKMYGFPYYDVSGSYGVCNRDNYVILGEYSDYHFKLLQKYLSSKLALYMYETTRYRMKYLEKYVFSFIPDITRMQTCGYNLDSSDEDLYTLFDLTSGEIKSIETLHKKVYGSFFNKN